MQTLAYRLAVGLKSRTPEHAASIEVIQFSLLVLINTLSTIVFSLGISLVTGKLAETALVMISFAVLRFVSGGIHLKYSWACMLVTSLGANAASFSQFSYPAIAAMTVASLLLALIYAPSRIDNQTRIPEKYYPLLKLLSLVIIASNFIIGSSVIAAAFLIQTILLIRLKGGEPS